MSLVVANGELYVIQSNVIKFISKLRKGADGTMVFSNNKTNL